MHSLIPVINRLQDVFNTISSTSAIDLPQIVVVGSQSSGKSSVLESFVGRDFLPRGTGVVTRRPLILQLITLPSPTNAPQEFMEQLPETLKTQALAHANTITEYAEFLHKPQHYLTSFEDIRTEIIAETERILGKNKAISAEPIRLTIYSPHVLTLTLVDLPGITKIAVGDQPVDIEAQIREIIISYISNPHCIILAVSAANQDLANSDALQLARMVDPYGLRTLGVLTKLDLMDSGTDASDVLLGKVYPLKLGFVGVVLRSQQDINDRKSITDALQHETTFLQRHPAYRPLAHRLGVSYLGRHLSYILMHHIKECLPEIKNRISSQIMDLESELASLGDPLNSSGHSQGALLLSLISKFCSNFCDAIDGRASSSHNSFFSVPISSSGSSSFASHADAIAQQLAALEVSVPELYGGARIAYTFHDLFARALESISPFDQLSDLDIRTAIRNATGPRPSLFVPEITFDLLVKRQIARLAEPSLQCCDLVFDELLQLAMTCDPAELSRFTTFREKLLESVSALLRRRLQPTKDMVSNLIQIELAYINTNHPDFIGGAKAVAQLSQTSSSTLESSPTAQASELTEAEMALANGGFFRSLFGNKDRASQSNQGPAVVQHPHPVSSAVEFEEDIKAADVPFKLPAQVPSALVPHTVPTERERIETAIIKSLISSYFNIVRKTVQDSVPKAVMCFLVNASKNELQSELVGHLYREDMFSDLLRESDHIAQRRSNTHQMLVTLRRALDICNEIRDFSLHPAASASSHTSAVSSLSLSLSTPHK